jgi:hypothetical protein
MQTTVRAILKHKELETSVQERLFATKNRKNLTRLVQGRIYKIKEKSTQMEPRFFFFFVFVFVFCFFVGDIKLLVFFFGKIEK